jgi:hypothetical protein
MQPSQRKRIQGLFDLQIDGLGTLALLIGFNFIAHALALVKRLQARTFDRRNMDKYVSPAIIGLDKSVTLIAIKKLDTSLLRHRRRSFPLSHINRHKNDGCITFAFLAHSLKTRETIMDCMRQPIVSGKSYEVCKEQFLLDSLGIIERALPIKWNTLAVWQAPFFSH